MKTGRERKAKRKSKLTMRMDFYRLSDLWADGMKSFYDRTVMAKNAYRLVPPPGPTVEVRKDDEPPGAI